LRGDEIAMLFEDERKFQIIQYLQKNQRASVPELGQLFNVSESTIRRDLKELEDAKLLKRTHGGAVSLQSANLEPGIQEKTDYFRNEKEKIAQKAYQLISAGDTILLDSGTTTLLLARELHAISDVRVITNSLLVLNELKDCRNVEISLVGGILRPETMAFVGPMTERSLDMITVDKVFLGTNGIDILKGITTPNLIEAATKSKMISIGNEIILLADHSKIGKISYAKVANVERIDTFIVDDQAPEEFTSQLKKLGVGITIA
jgi:DeoR family fructose operon transcriptional repressor